MNKKTEKIEVYHVKNSCSPIPKNWVEIGIDYVMNNLNEGKKFYKYQTSIGDGIFYEYSFQKSDMSLVQLNDDDANSLKNEFNCQLERMNEEKFIDVAMKILNRFPQLMESTCMGWQPYEDKTLNPNWMGGVFIFPDNNKYLVSLHKGVVRVYPGQRDAFGAWISSEPLAECKIDLNEWVKRIEKQNVEIHVIK